MKFVINDKRFRIVDTNIPNSGSINDYPIEVETDQSWEGLTKAIIICKGKETQGIARGVINNVVYIDMEKYAQYNIGFIGYTIENDTKVFQKSTNLQPLPYRLGAGEIETTNQEEIPTPTEWEQYLAQVTEFINDGNVIINEANNLNIDNDGTIVTITKKDGSQSTINVKGDKGDCNFATFEVNSNMELVMNTTEDMLLEFRLNNKNEMEVII